MSDKSNDYTFPYTLVPDGIALDTVNRRIYWTDTGSNMIERATMSGSLRQTVISLSLDQPRAIVIDVEGRYYLIVFVIHFCLQ